MFKNEAGQAIVPHPDEVQKAIDAKISEVKALRGLKRISYTAHGLTPPPKKAKKATPANAA